jgi:hypothetical protein
VLQGAFFYLSNIVTDRTFRLEWRSFIEWVLNMSEI